MGEIIELQRVWHTAVAIRYEPARAPGTTAELRWKGYDTLPGRPKLQEFLKNFEIGRIIEVRTTGRTPNHSWLGAHR